MGPRVSGSLDARLEETLAQLLAAGAPGALAVAVGPWGRLCEDVPLAVEFRRRSGDVILSRGIRKPPLPLIVSGVEAFPRAPTG